MPAPENGAAPVVAAKEPEPTPVNAASDGEEECRRRDLDADEDDDYENNLSLAAMEAEIKPAVLETFDRIASNYKKLRRLQDALVGGTHEDARR